MAAIQLDRIEKIFPNGRVAVRTLTLEIADGEFLVLVGPSGCGKSTVLRIVAGLETPTEGRVFIGDRDVTDLPPQARDIAMVFQTYALYPHKSVRENLEFGLRMRRAPRALIDERVARAAKTLDLEALLDCRPGQLSGGQRQRVALGRAIVREPRAFLFDEPLSNLDAKLRVQTRAELARMHRHLGATMLYVTHDQEEAMTLGDRVAVMRDGVLQQVAAPLEIYRRPGNIFVAGFIGSPSMNFFRCSLAVEGGRAGRAGRAWLRGDGFAIELPEAAHGSAPAGEALLGVRPQDLEIVPPSEADVVARVDVVEPLGSQLVIHFDLRGGWDDVAVRAVAPPEIGVRVDERMGLRFRRDRLHLFDAKSGERLN